MNSDYVIIVGAGPVGLVAGVSQFKRFCYRFEASADLAVDLRLHFILPH